MVTDDKNSGFQTRPMFLLKKLNQIYVDGERTRKFESETKKLYPTNNNLPYTNNLKRPMKNTTLRGLFAASLVLVSGNAFAQNATPVVSAPAISSATILQPIVITKNLDLKFGTLAGGNVKTVSTVGDVSGSAFETGDESAALFTLTKGSNVPFTMTVNFEPLDRQDGEEGVGAGVVTSVLPTTYTVEAISTKDESEAVPFSGAESALTRVLEVDGTENSNTDATTLSATNELNVRIGGTVSPVPGQAPGLYSGTITLTAVYN